MEHLFCPLPLIRGRFYQNECRLAEPQALAADAMRSADELKKRRGSAFGSKKHWQSQCHTLTANDKISAKLCCVVYFRIETN
ncbi:MAG: hypothetical protein VB878_23580 [Pirellulaceae bacterium]